jgi:hypothetical protein
MVAYALKINLIWNNHSAVKFETNGPIFDLSIVTINTQKQLLKANKWTVYQFSWFYGVIVCDVIVKDEK